jgi:hypothetical protein
MGSCSEKGESIATDPDFAMYHQVSLLTGSFPPWTVNHAPTRCTGFYLEQLANSECVSVGSQRYFPPPWTVEEANNACFIVKDANGVAVSYVYLRTSPGGVRPPTSQGRGPAHCRRQRDETQRIGQYRQAAELVGEKEPRACFGSGGCLQMKSDH